jgi:hypothetical protein
VSVVVNDRVLAAKAVLAKTSVIPRIRMSRMLNNRAFLVTWTLECMVFPPVELCD